jgi:hypothetical protein
LIKIDKYAEWTVDSKLVWCRKFAETRAEQMGIAMDDLADFGKATSSEADSAEERRKWRESRAASQVDPTLTACVSEQL